jgi:hypothetical protein
VTLVVESRQLGYDREPAQLVLRSSFENVAKASQKKACTKLISLAACCFKILDRGLERRNDFQRPRAFFSHLAVDGAQRVLSRLQTAARKEQSSLVHDASYTLLVVEDDCIRRIAALIAWLALAMAKNPRRVHGSSVKSIGAQA